MLKLLKKEFALSMHPMTPVMLLLSAMVLIPNYPYGVIFFYVTLSLFFTCLSGRENNDVLYSLTLPVPKRDVVRARICYAVILEIAQLVIMIPFVLLKQRLSGAVNQAGLDANLSLFGWGLILYALFNAVFFSGYYKDVKRVGVSFIKASALMFVCIAAEIAASYVIPFVRDCLDGSGAKYLPARINFLFFGISIFVITNVWVCRDSIKNFEKQDI